VKHKITSSPLDAVDRSPHPGKMSSDDKRKAQAREAKLAQALRANLRRRKVNDAAGKPDSHKKSDPD
jgi:hypothetical protein